MSQEKELGTLVIVVLKARNLLDPHSFYKSDVYAQISLNGEVKRTPVEVKGGQHPVWDAELRFNVMKNSAEKYRELKVSCWSKESRNDQNLGEGKVNINETLKTGEFDDWVGLSTEAGGARGDLYLEMTYYSAAPVPAASRLSVAPGADLVRRPSKLSPADRLSRPTQPSPLSTSGAHVSHHDNRRRDPSPHNRPPPSQLVPGRVSPQRPTSVSPKRANDPLPPLPNDRVQSPTIPAFLQPGAGRGKPSASSFQPSQSAQPPQPTLPDILKPGIPNGSSFHNPTPQPTSPLQQPVQPSHNPGSPPRHYTSYPTTHSPPPPSTYVSATGPPYAEPQIRPHPHINPYVSPPVQHPPVSPAPPAGPEPWVTQGPPQPSSVPLSFPMPMVAPSVNNDVYLPPFHAQSPRSPSPYNRPPPFWANDERDSYRQTPSRYQTPLPLPPNATPTPSQPLPSSPPPLKSPISEERIPPADAARLNALREAERKAAIRKEQEDKDAELARQLDRELNL